MAFTAKLVHKGGELDLGSDWLYLSEGFMPPESSEWVQLSEGSPMNEYDGGELISVAGSDFVLDVPLIAVVSSDGAGNRAIAEINSFIRKGLFNRWPIYFYWKSDNDSPVPSVNSVWGSYKICRVVWGQAMRSPGYGAFDRSANFDIDLILNLTPYISTNPQRVAKAKGAVQEVFSGNLLKEYYGTNIPKATTNLFTNPLGYGEPTPTSWSAGSGLLRTTIYDKKYVLWGDRSFKLTGTNATASNNTWTQSLTLTAVTHNVSFYVLMPDGSAPTSTACQVWYNGSARTTTFVQVGDTNWYRAESQFTGSGAAGAVGVVAHRGYTIYATAFQAEAVSHVTPFCFGEMPGCAWSGTAHQSTTARTAGLLLDTDSIDVGAGTICVTWKADKASSEDTTTTYLLYSSTMNLNYDGTNTRFEWTDGTNTANGATKTFTDGEIIVIHITWSKANGIKLYINGAASGSGNATYTPPTAEPLFAIGSDTTPTNHISGTFLGYTKYRAEFTAAQVTADYNNISPVASKHSRIDWLPYFWTKDGDNVVDCVNDSTRDDYGFLAGIAGSASARLVVDVTTSFSSNPPVYLSLMSTPEFVPADDLFADLSGTVIGATALGTEAEAVTVSTSENFTTPSALDANNEAVRHLSRKAVYFKVRLKEPTASGVLSARPILRLGATGDLMRGDWQELSATTSFKHFVLGPIIFPEDLARDYEWLDQTQIYWQIGFKRSTGSQAIHVDYQRIYPGEMTLVRRAGTLASAQQFILDGRRGFDLIGDDYVSTATVEGDLLALTPDAYNVLSVIPYLSGTADGLSDTFTFNRLVVTPRWQIS